MSNQLGWFLESANEKAKSMRPLSKTFAPTGVISEGVHYDESMMSFDERLAKIQESYEASGIDVRKDMKSMVQDRAFMAQYKEALMNPVADAFRAMSPGDPHIERIIENASSFWDNKVRLYNESVRTTDYLPMATLEFPVLLKQFFSSVLKDIMDVETTNTPAITRHIRKTMMVDNQTGAEYEYPKCFYDGTWEKLTQASKGHPIKDTVVTLTNGRLYKYDIIANLTDGTPGIDKLSFVLSISKIQVGAELIQLNGNGIRVEFSTGGTLINGKLDFTTAAGTVIADTISGQVDFDKGTIDIASTSGQVTGVVFEGALSNEKNLRSISVREKRDLLRFTIGDSGPRFVMPFTIEEIEDSAALLDMNYYNRMVDEIVKGQDTLEFLDVMKYLNEEFMKYAGVATDIFKLESVANTYTVDIKPDPQFAGDPFKYVASAVQFRLKALLNQLTQELKLDNLSFVISGNPMATQLMSTFTDWKSQQGTSLGGIQTNNSYGFATDLGAPVRVVASNIYDAYTDDVVVETGKRETILNITGFPTDEEHISFKHLKYTSHIMTSQSQTAYQSPNAPGGAYNIVTAVSRYLTLSVQGIQAKLIMLNSDIVYGAAPTRTKVDGSPWTPLVP